MTNMTSSRAELMQEMLAYGPRNYDHVHWGWMRDLIALERGGLVSKRKGLWRVTRKGRVFFKQRTGATWV